MALFLELNLQPVVHCRLEINFEHMHALQRHKWSSYKGTLKWRNNVRITFVTGILVEK